MTERTALSIDVGGPAVDGDLTVPDGAHGLVVFAHGSGSSRRSTRNRQVAAALQQAGLATLLFDLLTPEEEREEQVTGHLRFDVDMLGARLLAATEWVGERRSDDWVRRLGYFGASTGAAGALVAAAALGDRVAAVVSRGGRPDLAGDDLTRVTAPTLLVVGGRDEVVLRLNEEAAARLRCPHRLEVVPGATHLFEEPGALEEVARLATGWFGDHLAARSAGSRSGGA